MRLNNIVRGAIAGGASLALAFGLTACSRDYTVAYVYTVSASQNTISAFAVDYQTGIPNQIAGSPFASNVTDPLTVVAAPNNKYIYVIGGPNGNSSNQLEEYAVGTDGKIYGQHTYTLTGTYATGAAIDSTGTFLYVTFQYQNGFTPASPGPGGVSIFPINSDNSLGTPTTLNVGVNPVGIAISAPVCVAAPLVAGNPTCSGVTGGSSGTENVYVYIVDQEASPTPATVLGYAQNMKTGALQPLSSTTFNPTLKTFQGYAAGVTPSAIAIDGTARYVYVTDRAANQLIGYQIARTTTGNLTPLSGSPFGTGAFPVSVTIDPRALYVYTANFNSNTISGFAISQSTGNLSVVSGNTFPALTGPTCISIEPALGQYIFTSNFVSGDLSAGTLNSHTGVLTATANSPYPTGGLPSCLTSVANGAHAISVVSP